MARFGPPLIAARPAPKDQNDAKKQKSSEQGKKKIKEEDPARKAELAMLCSDAERAAREARWGKVAAPVAGNTLNTPLDLELLAVKYREERRDVAASAKVRLNVLHVYGLDGIDAEQIVKHFSGHAEGGVQLEWINNSSCNVVFASDAAAETTLNALAPPCVAEAIFSFIFIYIDVAILQMHAFHIYEQVQDGAAASESVEARRDQVWGERAVAAIRDRWRPEDPSRARRETRSSGEDRKEKSEGKSRRKREEQEGSEGRQGKEREDE